MRDVVVARVRRAHGLAGQILVQPETEEPAATYRAGRVFRVPEAPAGLSTRLTLESASAHAKGGWRLEFREISDRETAQSYAGCSLELPAEELTALADDEYFLHDLVGLAVVDAGGRAVGRIEWVFDRPGQPLLAVTEESRGEKRERLIPFSAAIVDSVDVAAGIVRIDPPSGLLDL